MTKHYYLTQEEALEIAEPYGHNILSVKADIMFTKEDLADCINAALDKVLGEPVGETIPLLDGTLSESMFGIISDRVFEKSDKSVKLYAPKGLT